MGKVASQKSRKRKLASASESDVRGTQDLCARARAVANPRQELKASGSLSTGWPSLEWVSSPRTARAGLSAPRPIGGAAGRMCTTADPRSEGEAWARPRPRIYKGEVWTDARSRRLGCPGGANLTAPPAADVRHAEPCFAVPGPGLGG